jgi:hypothetical protein
METKQTAVQWLKEKLPSLFIDDNNGFYSKLFEQALQMEREQIEDAWMDGMDGILHKIAAEKYYNETYGGQDDN